MSETSLANVFDEQKKMVFNQQNVGEEENNYISNSYSLLEQARKTENSFQSMCTIQSSTSAAESSLDVGAVYWARYIYMCKYI